MVLIKAVLETKTLLSANGSSPRFVMFVDSGLNIWVTTQSDLRLKMPCGLASVFSVFSRSRMQNIILKLSPLDPNLHTNTHTFLQLLVEKAAGSDGLRR